MLSQKNLISVNERLDISIKEQIRGIIDKSGLNEASKQQEFEFLDFAILPGDVFNIDFIRKNISKTAFARLYSYLLGYTNVQTTENELNVNLRFFNKIGDIAQNLQNAPVIGSIAGAVGTIAGTSTTCGLIGGLFNTKKCREKQQAQQNNASSALQQMQQNNSSILQPQYVPAVMPQNVPAVMPQKEQKEVSRNKDDEPKESFFEKYKLLLIGGAVLFAIYFLFLRKKR